MRVDLQNNCQVFLKRMLKTGLLLGGMLVTLSACQFQPLYSSSAGTTGSQNFALSQMSVAEVDTREAQQVRNHLIFLLSGGSTPLDPTHEVRLRVTTTKKDLAAAISGGLGQSTTGSRASVGNTAGSVQISASYEIYDLAKKEIVFRGNRNANASFDQTSQTFASQRAERDAENRAAREVAEQLRFAIGSDLNRI